MAMSWKGSRRRDPVRPRIQWWRAAQAHVESITAAVLDQGACGRGMMVGYALGPYPSASRNSITRVMQPSIWATVGACFMGSTSALQPGMIWGC